MPFEAATSSIAVPGRPIRAAIEIEADALVLTAADGGWQRIALAGAEIEVRDAAFAGRFVRHAAIRLPDRRIDLITPPEEGAIAPRAARLPGVPDAAAILPGAIWETVVDWLLGGGGLSGRTVEELARLACLASAQLAIVLGRCAGQLAAELCSEQRGLLRRAGTVDSLLRPLARAARTSPRAAAALAAALSCTR